MNHKLDYVLWGGVIVKVGPEPSAYGAKNCLHVLDLRGLGWGGGGSCCSPLPCKNGPGSPVFRGLGLVSEKGNLYDGFNSFLLNKPFPCWLLWLEKFI